MTTLPFGSSSSQAPYPDPIPGVIPFGSLCIFMGPPKRGKTALLADWFARLRDGRPICGLPTNRPTALGLLTTDHKWHLNQAGWFAKAGFPDVRYYALRDQPDILWRKLKTPAYADMLVNRALDALALPPGGFLGIDVMGPFLTSRLNDYAEVVGGLGTISQFMDRRQLTLLGLSHMSKQKGDTRDQYKDPYERIMGSGAQIGFSDTMFYLLGPKEISQPYYEVGWQPTHAPSGTFNFGRNDLGLFVPYSTDAAAEGGEEPSEADQQRLEAVVDQMPSDPPGWTRKQLKTAIELACAVKERRADQLIWDLQQRLYITRVSRGRYVKTMFVRAT